MSLTIEDLNFTIFASGHDYTLADSGDGEVQVFSHPFVPLNSLMYAGQWYFLVPDENGEPLDAVKDDLAHCTFTPALGSAFGTEGEITVECHYHREYIYPEDTLVVDKTVSQTITVVNHGNITRPAYGYYGRWFCGDIYEDGYIFLRPANVNNLDGVTYCDPAMNGDVTKVSSFYWRTEEVGGYGGFITSSNVTDIEELKFADVSNVKRLRGLIEWCGANPSLEPVAEWDVSNVTDMGGLFSNASNITTLHGLEKWNTSSNTSLQSAFETCQRLSDISALADWDVSNVVTMENMFFIGSALTDLTPLSKWDTSSLENMQACFHNVPVSSLHGLEDWDVSHLKNMAGAFRYCPLESLTALSKWNPPLEQIAECFMGGKLKSLEGVEEFDVSRVSNFGNVFNSNTLLISLHGLEDWDVSSAKVFSGMFEHCPWISDVSALAEWDTSSLEATQRMFGGTSALLDVSAFDNWDFTNATNLSGMFQGFTLYWSSAINKKVWANAYYYFDYEGNQYTNAVVQPLTAYTKDASNASSWNVQTSNMGAFDDKWTNVPSWN